MVSERYESMARESRWSSYCVFDAMACDAIPQKNESLKKEVVDIRSIAANIKQQLRDHMAKINQQFKEMIEELRIIRSQSGSYIENSTKPRDYPQLEIKSAGFTSNKEKVSNLSDDKPVITTIIADDEEETKEKGEEVDLIDHSQSDSNQNGEELDLIDYCKSDSNQNHNGEEAVHTPDWSHDTVFDFTSETKPVPDSSIVTMMIREEREKVLPVEKKRELVVGEGSSDYVFDLGGYESTKPRCADSPESGGLGWRLDPGSDPPDGSFSIPLADSTPLALTIESSKSIIGVGHNHPDRRVLPVVPPPSSGAKVTEVGSSDEIGFQTVYIGSGFWLKKEKEKSTRPILMNLVGPKPSKFISTCPNLNPNVIRTINRLTDTVTTYSGYWLGDDRRKLPPQLPSSLPPPLLPLTTRSTSNAYGTSGNRWWETDNRFDTCKEIGKKSQTSEKEKDGYLKEKNQEVEFFKEKNQIMEVFNSIVGVKIRHYARPISTLSTGSSTLFQNSNPYATQFIQFAAAISQFREPYETTSSPSLVGVSFDLVTKSNGTIPPSPAEEVEMGTKLLEDLYAFLLESLCLWQFSFIWCMKRVVVILKTGAMELNWEDLISVAADWGDPTWQHLFLYFFYPP